MQTQKLGFEFSLNPSGEGVLHAFKSKRARDWWVARDPRGRIPVVSPKVKSNKSI